MTPRIPENIIEQLRQIVGSDDVLAEFDEVLPFECDAMTSHKHVPGAVVIVSNTEEVSQVVRLLSQNSIPFVARGAGTGLSGGAVALHGGVIIEMARMNRILEIDYANQLAVVESGLVNIRLSQAVASEGYYYAPDPSSQTACTIGGNVAENSGGPHCLKYGMTTNHILGLEVVLPNGEIVNLGGGLPDAPGYDLLGVFVGSEGTFGIVTKVTVRLTRLPQAVKTMLAEFTSVVDASRAVSAIIAAGILPAAIELMDNVTIRVVEESVYAAGYPKDAAAVLLIELDGLEAGIDRQVERVGEICRANGSRNVRLAKDATERARLWAGRKGVFGALGRISPDLMVQDAVIPRTRLPEVLDQVYKIGEKYKVKVSNVFHAGDGNLHPNISYDGRDREQTERVKAASAEIMELCVKIGGSITGEHGVGVDKIDYMPLIFSDTDLTAMLKVRSCFNPDGLLNPGKVIPVRKCGMDKPLSELRKLEEKLGILPI